MSNDLDDRCSISRAATEAGCQMMGLLAESRHARVHAVLAEGRSAVLKVIAEEADPVMRLRFAREGRIGLILRHPNLVETSCYGNDWILLGHLRGASGGAARSLIDRVQETGSNPAIASDLGGIAEALAYMHARGLVHRDVKPGNILIGQYDRLVLIDLGAIGLAIGDDLGVGEFIGSPAWMAPEQIRGAPPRTSADIYALALVFAYALGGIPAFAGAADEVVQHRRLGGGPRNEFLRGLDAIADPALRHLVRTGLSEDPSARPPAEAFAVRCGL